MKLLISAASPYVRKVRVLIREAGREGEVEERAVSTTPFATDPALLLHNPTGRIPVLALDDRTPILDSRAICRFLDARWGLGLYPEARAEGVLDSALLMSYEVRLRPAERQWPDWMEAQWTKIARTLDDIEERWTDHLRERLDMGQVALGCALGYLDLRHGTRDWRAGRPRFAAWEEAMSRCPAMAATAPARDLRN